MASYPNPVREDDFRSSPSLDPADYSGAPDAGLAELALAATAALGLEFGGVDILRGTDAAAMVLEVNMPCYYAQAQEVAGIDIAGAMVEHLLNKSSRLAGQVGST